MNKRYNVSFKVLSNWGNNYNKIIIIKRKGKHFTFAEAAPTFFGFFTERSLRGTSSRHGILTSPKSSTSSPWSLSISSNPASLRAAGPSLVPGFVYKCKHKTIFMNRAHTKHCQVNFIQMSTTQTIVNCELLTMSYDVKMCQWILNSKHFSEKGNQILFNYLKTVKKTKRVNQMFF